MKLLIAALTTLMIAAPLQAAEIPSKDLARMLDKSVAEYQLPQGFCTATKIGARDWLTAGHCVSYDSRLETSEGEYLFPRSITTSVSIKEDGKRREDWAILHVTSFTPNIPALELACGNPAERADPIAYLGFPVGTDRAYMEGLVATTERLRSRGNRADWAFDVAVAGGASGSAVVHRETGHILGVLTEGIFSSRTGFYLAAAESIQNLDVCKDWNEQMKDWGEDEMGDFTEPPKEDKSPEHT